MDLDKTVFTTTTKSFKNTGILTTSIEVPTSIPAGGETINTATVTLPDNQVFVFARAYYTEIIRDSGPVWQVFPTFDGKAMVTSPYSGPTSFYLTSKITNNMVTFSCGIFNPGGSTMTVTAQTIPIAYATYTVDS